MDSFYFWEGLVGLKRQILAQFLFKEGVTYL